MVFSLCGCSGAMGNNAVPQSTVISAYVCEIRYAKIVFCSVPLEYKGFLLCGVRPPSNFQLSTFCFRQQEDTVPHISILFAPRAFTWLLRRLYRWFFVSTMGSKKSVPHILVCASFNFCSSNFNGMKQFYWNLILEMMVMRLMLMEKNKLIWNIYNTL